MALARTDRPDLILMDLVMPGIDGFEPMVGALSDLDFRSSTVQVDALGLLSLYSDGAFEVERPDGSVWPLGEFIAFIEAVPRLAEVPGMGRLIEHARAMKGSDEFADDVSIVEFLFSPPA